MSYKVFTIIECPRCGKVYYTKKWGHKPTDDELSKANRMTEEMHIVFHKHDDMGKFEVLEDEYRKTKKNDN